MTAKPTSQPLLEWLLDSDPSIRWQALRDVGGASARERARVATEGWGAKLLALQAADGRWGGAAWNRGWNSTMHALMLLRDFGLDPASDEARRAIRLVREHVTWEGCGPPACDGNPFFEGEQEPCINAQVAAVGAYFGEDVSRLIVKLLVAELAGGGWNCDERPHASFNTTIVVLEALHAYESAFGATRLITEARHRGEQYLLARRLARRLSTGEPIERDRKSGAHFTQFAFPTWWHYDVLRGLEYLTLAGYRDDARMREALALVESKRDASGRWPLDAVYPGVMPVDLNERDGEPSRWITLRALRLFAEPR